jgi:hypothetical protein
MKKYICIPTFHPIVYAGIALLIAFGVWGYFLWASYGHLPERVEAMQKEIELLKAQPDSSKAYLLDLQKLELKIEKTEHSIRSDFFVLQKLGIPLTVIAFALMFFSIYKSALGFALKHAEETVNRYYLPDEERFKREKKLLVLTKEGGDSGFVRKLLQDTGFLAAATIPDNVKKLDEDMLGKLLDGKNYDLIFLNNERVAFDDDEIKICHGKTPGYTMIFSFNKNLPGDVVASPRAASANFKSQIYGNLINALKYQQYLHKPSADKA